MAPEGGRAAAFDGRHDLELAEAQVTGICTTPDGPVVAEDIRDLQCWTAHSCGVLALGFLASLGSPVRLGQEIERALDEVERNAATEAPAPRSGGAASCHCDAAGASDAGGTWWLMLALAVLARRRRVT